MQKQGMFAHSFSLSSCQIFVSMISLSVPPLAVIAKRLEELDDDEVQALVEEVEGDDF